MRILVWFISYCLMSLCCAAQSKNLAAFIPESYTLLDSASGDLNKDGNKDLVIILKNVHEESFSETSRPLLILHGDKNRKYTLIARNDSVVLCQGCGGVFGDPYEGIAVKNNYFSVEHYGGSNWRWTRIITFKYDLKNKQYVLHKDAGVSYHTSDPDKITKNIHSKKSFGKLLFSEYNYNID